MNIYNPPEYDPPEPELEFPYWQASTRRCKECDGLMLERVDLQNGKLIINQYLCENDNCGESGNIKRL